VTVIQALAFARATLTAGGIEEAPLESEILLRHVLKIDRLKLYLSTETELSRAQEDTFRELITRRRKGEPAAYITGNREFYGLDFYVDSRVLIPRPETELLVTMALEYARENRVEKIADIGTGCGNIAICLAMNLPHTRIYATDISSEALKVARMNCGKYGVSNVQLLHGNLLEPIPEAVDIIVSNMPYVKQSELCNVNTSGCEPAMALDGGKDGLEVITRLCEKVDDRLHPGGCLLLEIGIGQKEAVASLLQRLFPSATIEVTRDLGGIERVVEVHKRV
jgi:release factor glutamine methyltransferase